MTGGAELNLQENEETKAVNVSLHIAVCAAQTLFPRAVKYSPTRCKWHPAKYEQKTWAHKHCRAASLHTTYHVLAVSSKGFFYIQSANSIVHVVVDVDRTLPPYRCLCTGTRDGLRKDRTGQSESEREHVKYEKWKDWEENPTLWTGNV